MSEQHPVASEHHPIVSEYHPMVSGSANSRRIDISIFYHICNGAVGARTSRVWLSASLMVLKSRMKISSCDSVTCTPRLVQHLLDSVRTAAAAAALRVNDTRCSVLVSRAILSGKSLTASAHDATAYTDLTPKPPVGGPASVKPHLCQHLQRRLRRQCVRVRELGYAHCGSRP